MHHLGVQGGMQMGYSLLGCRKDQLLCEAQGAQCDDKVKGTAPPCRRQTARWGKLVQGPDICNSPFSPEQPSGGVSKALQWKAAVLLGTQARHISNNRKPRDPSQAVPGRCCMPRVLPHTQPAGGWAPCLSGQLRAASCSE